MASAIRSMHEMAGSNIGSMIEAEGLYRNLLDFRNEALVIVSESGTVLLAPKEAQRRLQKGERSLNFRRLSDSALAAKYDTGAEPRQAFLLESKRAGVHFDEWAPALWSKLKSSGIDGILVLYDNYA